MFMRVGSIGNTAKTDRLADLTHAQGYLPSCTQERLQEAQRKAALMGTVKPPVKSNKLDSLEVKTNAFALPPHTEAALRKAQIKAASMGQ